MGVGGGSEEGKDSGEILSEILEDENRFLPGLLSLQGLIRSTPFNFDFWMMTISTPSSVVQKARLRGEESSN